NDAWVNVSAPITINPPAAPVWTTINQAHAQRGSTVSVAIGGSNLCNVSLSTSWSGLTFTDITSNGTVVQANFALSSSAPVGTATVTLTASGGSTNLTFQVEDTQQIYHLHKETNLGFLKLLTAGPDAADTFTQSANLRDIGSIPYTQPFFQRFWSVTPTTPGLIPANSTVTFNVWLDKTANFGTV